MCLPPVAYPRLSRPYPGAKPGCEPPRARGAWRARGGARGGRPASGSNSTAAYINRGVSQPGDPPRLAEEINAVSAVGDARRAPLGRPPAEVAALVDAGWATCPPVALFHCGGAVAPPRHGAGPAAATAVRTRFFSQKHEVVLGALSLVEDIN